MESLPHFDQNELHELETLFQVKLEEAKDSFEQLVQEWDEDDGVRQGFASRYPHLASRYLQKVCKQSGGVPSL